MKRFWDKVKIGLPSECWEWGASKIHNGYGHFGFRGKIALAHRVAWELTNGQIPKGEGFHGTCVLHKCDNRSCCNPQHLFLGSNADNVRDKIKKGRTKYLHGDNHPMRKLDSGKARIIRSRLAKGEKRKDLATEFDVSISTIDYISTNTIWRNA